MNILHYSDQHDTNVKELLNQADVLFCTGDLTMFDFLDVEETMKTKNCFGVYGNHCVPGYLERYGINNMHLRVLNFDGLKIGGFEGCLRYKEKGGPQFTEEEAKIALSTFPGVDILLLHAPPFGLLDDPTDPVHTGSHTVRSYIDTYKPQHVFCGHISPSMDLDYEGTKIHRTHQARIIHI
jgi:uncharacterized protein